MRRLFYLSTLLPMLAFASATENEFEPCKKLAVATLQGCLAQQSALASEVSACWQDSEAAFKRCRQEVIDSHNPDLRKQRMEAERKARAEAEARAKQTKSGEIDN